MLDHSHNVQVCAGCVSGDMKLALSLIRDFNDTLAYTIATVAVERILAEITETIDDAASLVSAASTEAEAGLGKTAVHGRARNGSGPSVGRASQD